MYVSGSGADIETRPAGQPLLIRHLLTHTSGLTFGFYHSHPVDALYRDAGLESSVAPGADLAGTCDVYAGLPLQFEPGTEWNYSVSTNVLGRLIEVVSGQDLDVFLAERIFGPLGMTDAGFCVTDEQAGRLAELYGEDAEGRITPIAGLLCTAARASSPAAAAWWPPRTTITASWRCSAVAANSTGSGC